MCGGGERQKVCVSGGGERQKVCVCGGSVTRTASGEGAGLATS